MKKLFKKDKVVKGRGSAVVISVLIHASLFLLAGLVVVFTVIDKPEKKFEPPPPVERKKMDLKRPKVRVKKTAKPSPARRITAKVSKGMPDIQLPTVAGVGKGLGDGVGGFELMPDVSEMSLYGGTKSTAIGNDFEGTFYSLQYDRRGRELAVGENVLYEVLHQFMDADWNPIVFAPYYRAPQKLYTTSIFIPPISSEFAPKYFGVDLGEKVSPTFWVVHYKGKIARKEGGRFRFWGGGDDYLVVRVNKKIVLNTRFFPRPFEDLLPDWPKGGPDKEFGKYGLGMGLAGVGDWFELEPGVPVEMEVIFGEWYGGWSEAMLMVEDANEDYARNREGMPILPIFKTEDLPKPLIEKIEYLMIRDEAILDDPLKFNVY